MLYLLIIFNDLKFIIIKENTENRLILTNPMTIAEHVLLTGKAGSTDDVTRSLGNSLQAAASVSKRPVCSLTAKLCDRG
jgi:hypothetical protein